MALWTPRLFKPTDFVRTNLAHPQARELAFFLHYVGRGSFFDSVTGKIEGTASGQTPLATSEGNVVHFGGTTRSTGTAFNNPGAVNQNNCTVIAKLRLTTKPATRTAAIHYGVSSNGSGPYVGFDSSGFAHAGCAGSNGTNASDNKDAVDHTGQWVVVAGSWLPTGAKSFTAGTPCVWVNGVGKFSGPTGAGSASSNAAPNTLALGREIQNYNNFFVGDIAWAVGLNRLLSDDEHAWWAQHAYEVLEQRINQTFFSMPATGSTAALTGRAGALTTGKANASLSTALAAKGSSASRASAASSLSTALAARGGSGARGSATVSLATALVAKGASIARGVAAASLSTALAARGSALSRASAAVSLSTALVARGSSWAPATVAASLSAALSARGSSQSSGRTLLGAAVALSSRGIAAARASALAGLSIALASRGTSTSRASVGTPGLSTPLSARGSVRAAARSGFDLRAALNALGQAFSWARTGSASATLFVDLGHVVRAEARRIVAFAPPRTVITAALPRRNVAFWGTGMETFSPAKSPGAQWTLAFTFNRALKDDPTVPDGWTIDPNSFAVEVINVRPTGKDDNPSAILNGEAVRNSTGFVYGGETISARQALFQSVTGGVGGCVYRLKASCTVAGGIGPFEMFAELQIADVV